MPIQRSDKNKEVFFYLLLLTMFFFLLEASFFIQSNRIYLSDFTFVSDNIHIPITILPGIIYFIFAQLLIHFVYCVFVWIITVFISNLLHLTASRSVRLGVIIWLVGIITALAANQCFFPNSKFSDLTSVIFFTPKISRIALIILLLVSLNLLLVAMVGLLQQVLWYKNKFATITLASVLFLAISLFASWFITSKPSYSIHQVLYKSKPNIILVGVDSLRPDFLSYFGFENMTPFFDSFLDNATVFNETVTPLARTFPSWASILLGQHPRQTGIRFNLPPQEGLHLSDALPAILQLHGYETVFATDETRFSNMDKNFGFDHIITPPMGLNDFLIGTFNDFPLSNLLINTKVGQWLFPYSYANRPVYITYKPDSFLNLIHPILKKERKKPLFLAIHFCLTHYPYLWAGLPGNNSNILERYQASIKQVDKQISSFFNLLQKYHLLDQAIVILLSDHGEALELPGDRITEKELFLSINSKKNIPEFYPPSLDKEEVNQSAGHGTDVLGLPQYHTLLAFKLYGFGPQQQAIIPGVVSLLDIKPTLLELIGLKNNNKLPFSGRSLAPIIKGQSKNITENAHIFIESDFSPEAIRTVYPETRKVMLEGIELFQVDPITTRLTVKNKMGTMIINSKQYADIYGEWMLALYPQNKNFRMPILVNLVSGQWTNDLHSIFAKKSPAAEMLEAMKAFYGDELRNV